MSLRNKTHTPFTGRELTELPVAENKQNNEEEKAPF